MHWSLRSVRGCFLLAGYLAASPSWAQEHSQHVSESHEHFHRNELALVLASTYEAEKGKNFFTIGGEYERRLTSRFGISATVEHLSDVDAWVFVFPVTIRLVRGLKFMIGPGFEHLSRRASLEGHEDPHESSPESSPAEEGADKLFLFRFGVHYGFEFGGRYSITPGVDLDLINEEHGLAKAIVYG